MAQTCLFRGHNSTHCIDPQFNMAVLELSKSGNSRGCRGPRGRPRVVDRDTKTWSRPGGDACPSPRHRGDCAEPSGKTHEGSTPRPTPRCQALVRDAWGGALLRADTHRHGWCPRHASSGKGGSAVTVPLHRTLMALPAEPPTACYSGPQRLPPQTIVRFKRQEHYLPGTVQTPTSPLPATPESPGQACPPPSTTGKPDKAHEAAVSRPQAAGT